MKRIIVLLFLIVGVSFCNTCYSYQSIQAMRSAYLFNFSKFIQWPTNSKVSDRINLCVAEVSDEDKFQLSTVNGLSNGKQLLRVNYFDKAKPFFPEQCNMVYVNSQSEKWFSQYQAKFSRDVLIISENVEIEDAIIVLRSLRKRLTFKINKEIAEDKGLKISSKLLRLSKDR